MIRNTAAHEPFQASTASPVRRHSSCCTRPDIARLPTPHPERERRALQGTVMQFAAFLSHGTTIFVCQGVEVM
jgi:hypothetical protein